jgi:hypothetical protein
MCSRPNAIECITKKRPVLIIAAVILCVSQSGFANVLVNGDFEAPANLLPGQSPVGPWEEKSLVENTTVPGFEFRIHSIPSWLNSYDNGVRDAGLRRIPFSGSGESQYASTNNWENRISQTSSLSVMPGYSYRATIDVGMGDLSKGGRFQLWAGTPSVSNPDVFDPGSVLLGQVTVGSTGFGGFTPDVVVPLNQWTTVYGLAIFHSVAE